MEVIENLEELNLTDIKDLSSEEKNVIWQQIEEICQNAERIEESVTGSGKCQIGCRILQQVDNLKDKAVHVKQKLLITSGKQCHDPGEISHAIHQSKLDYLQQEEVVQRLHRNCSDVGLEFRGVTPGNGNCFFEAISSQLDRLGLQERNARELRVSMTTFVLENRNIMGPDGQIDLQDFVDNGSLENYCTNMSGDGVFADHLAVIGMARMLQRDILVVTSSPGAGPNDTLTWIVGALNSRDSPILLGHFWENHYQSLQPIGETASCNGNTISESKEKSVNEDENDPFVQWVKERYCKNWRGQHSNMFVQRIGSQCDEDDFIAEYLEKLESQQKGIFSQRHRNKNTIQYFCERHMKPRGSKRGPLKTRANSCPSFISFRFISHKGKHAVIIRRRLNHVNHDISNAEERRVGRLDTALVAYINGLIEQGKKPSEILVKAVKWSKQRGKHDVSDRTFFPTPVDVKNIIQNYKSKARYHNNDAVAVEYLCNTLLKDSIVYYQPLQQRNGQSLIIIYQNAEQRRRMQLFASNVIFMDATYKGITSYGYAFYCIIVRDDQGRGSPIAYMITSDDNSISVGIFLRKLKESAAANGFEFEPRSVMIDRDMKELSAVKAIFPKSQVLLCWFHVLQAIYRWLNNRDSGVSGNQNAETRKKIVLFLKKMRQCTERDQFNMLSDRLFSEMPTQCVAKYLQQNWIPFGEMWSNFGRKFFHEDQDTNNIVERFFLGLKYHFLGGYGNARVEDLLLLIHENITTFYNYMEELAKAGRLKNMRTLKEARGKKAAEKMMLAGFAQKIIWHTDYECYVPSETQIGKSYIVDIIKATCGCVASAQGGLCKHFHLAQLVAQQRGIDENDARQNVAKKIVEDNEYVSESSSVEVFYGDQVGIVHLGNLSCTCIASSHKIKCICVIVAEILFPNTCMYSVDYNESNNAKEPKEKKPSTMQIIKTKLEDIVTWVNDGNLNNCSKLEEIKHDIDKLHSSIFCSKFKKVCKKRKIEPIKTFRVKKTDHSYHTTCTNNKKRKKVNSDGSFKHSGRTKGAIRKSFK